MFTEALKMVSVVNKTDLVATAVDVAINGKSFIISNIGAQPAYIHPTATATAENGIIVPALTTLPTVYTCSGNLSVISNATGTDLNIIFVE